MEVKKDKSTELKKMEEIVKELGIDSRMNPGKMVGTQIKKKEQEESDGSLIYDALEHKTFVYDEEKDRLLAFTNSTIIEVTPKIINDVMDAVENYTKHVFKRMKKKGITPKEIDELLSIYECVTAAHMDNPRFDRLRKDFNKFLKDKLENGDEETKQIVKKGIEGFFETSKGNISRGLIKFDNIRYRVDKKGDKTFDMSMGKGLTMRNEEEKELLRNSFILQMLEDGVFDYDFLFSSGIITGMDFTSAVTLLKSTSALSNEQLENAFFVSGAFDTREEILEYFYENDKRFFIDFASVEELYDYLSKGKLDNKEVVKKFKITEIKDLPLEKLEGLLSIQNFPKNAEFIRYMQDKETKKQDRFISPDLFKVLDREKIMGLVFSNKLSYRNPLVSEDYVGYFGKLNLEDIKKLYENGLINRRDIIKLSGNKSLKAQDESKYNEMLAFILDTYDAETLSEMIDNNEINQKFIEVFNKDVLGNIPQEIRKQYFDRMYDKVLENKENGDKLLIKLLSNGFEIDHKDGFLFSSDTLSDMYLEEEITENCIIEFYKKKFVNKDVIDIMFSAQEIAEKYKEGKFDVEVLNLVQNRKDLIRQELEERRISMKDVIALYSEEFGIDIEELKYILENQSLEDENLAEYILDTIDSKKIEGLFSNFFISHDDLTELVSRGLMSKEDADEYARKIATHESFEALFGNSTLSAILTKDTPEGESKVPGLRIPSQDGIKSRAASLKIDPDLQRIFIDEIGFDDREIILRGENNSLDGYSIRASEEYGLMVFLNPDKPGNASYIMSLQQGMFFLTRLARRRQLEDATAIQNDARLESTATKQELRETEHVKVRNASRKWGKNMLDSMRKLSTELDRKFKENTEYKNRISEMIDAIRDDYDERRIQSL